MAVAKEKVANTEKLKALQATLDRLDKSYGKGTVMRLGDNAIEEMEVISSGSVTINRALLEDFQKEELLRFMVLSHQVKQL